ncbi:MAG: Lrp/AsnC family transcriptional regulator [Candidatus Micrarchaeia archaeon]|jgi:Lrp/AsnC family leucine-responsive transcriptional regulator
MAGIKLDSTDLHLLFLLDEDARAPLTGLSRRMKLSREAVNYRIRRLQKAGVIRAFITKLDYRKLGLVNYNIYAKLSNMDAAMRGKLVEELSRKKHITWLASLGGRFDFAIEITTGSLEEFDMHFSEIFDSYPDKIGNYQVQVATRIFQAIFPKKYLWQERARARAAARAAHEKAAETDLLDRKIISCLATDARASVLEVSRRASAPATTISSRLRRLERTGIIEGYTTLSNLEMLGYSRFKAFITVRNFSRKDETRLLSFCQEHPNVYYFTKTLGSWNYEIEVDVKSPQEYQCFLMEFRSKFGSVVHDIESLSIFEEHKFTYWPF